METKCRTQNKEITYSYGKIRLGTVLSYDLLPPLSPTAGSALTLLLAAAGLRASQLQRCPNLHPLLPAVLLGHCCYEI